MVQKVIVQEPSQWQLCLAFAPQLLGTKCVIALKFLHNAGLVLTPSISGFNMLGWRQQMLTHTLTLYTGQHQCIALVCETVFWHIQQQYAPVERTKEHVTLQEYPS